MYVHMYILVAYIDDMLEVKVKIVQTQWEYWNSKKSSYGIIMWSPEK